MKRVSSLTLSWQSLASLASVILLSQPESLGCQARLLRTDEASELNDDYDDDQEERQENSQDAMLERIFSLHDPDVFVAHQIWQHPKDLNK